MTIDKTNPMRGFSDAGERSAKADSHPANELRWLTRLVALAEEWEGMAQQMCHDAEHNPTMRERQLEVNLAAGRLNCALELREVLKELLTAQGRRT